MRIEPRFHYEVQRASDMIRCIEVNLNTLIELGCVPADCPGTLKSLKKLAGQTRQQVLDLERLVIFDPDGNQEGLHD